MYIQLAFEGGGVAPIRQKAHTLDKKEQDVTLACKHADWIWRQSSGDPQQNAHYLKASRYAMVGQ